MRWSGTSAKFWRCQVVVNCFDFLEKTLYIVATELDSGSRAVFGEG